MRALTAPASLFPAPEDWGDTTLNSRIERAATELAVMISTGIGSAITGHAWNQYQHRYGVTAARPEGSNEDIDFDTDLTRLPTCGALTARS